MRQGRDLSILMTADVMGGVWTYAIALAENLALRGVRVTLATMGDRPTAEQRRRAAEIPGLSLLESDYQLEWMADPWRDVARAGDWLLSLERRFCPDIVHLNGYCHGALPWRAPTLMVAHSCVLSWWEAVKGEPAPARYDRYRKEVTRGVKAAAQIAAPTAAMMREVERHYGGRKDGIILENGHDPASFVRRDNLVRFNGAEKEPIVLCVTRVWDEAKNVATLAKAAEGIFWPVFVAGEPRAPGEDSGSIGRFDHVTLLGRIEQPAALSWLARAAIFALPALYEPFGLSALEAACAGAALVLGDIPSLREIWGDAAVYVPPRDTDALRGAVNTLIRDERLRIQMATRARQRGLSLSASRMAERYLDAYADLCLRAPPPALAPLPLHGPTEGLGERTVS